MFLEAHTFMHFCVADATTVDVQDTFMYAVYLGAMYTR